MMGKYRFTSRTMLATMKKNNQGLNDADTDKVMVGIIIIAVVTSIRVQVGESLFYPILELVPVLFAGRLKPLSRNLTVDL